MSIQWTALADEPPRFRHANFEALGRQQPKRVRELAAQADRRDIWIGRENGRLAACRYWSEGREWTVHGQAPPADEAAALCNAVNQALDKGAWAVALLGCGMAPAVPACAAYLHRSRRGEPKGLILVEQDPGLLCAGLTAVDFSAAILSGRLLFAPGPNTVDRLREIYAEHRLETLEWGQIRLLPGHRIADPERLADYQHLRQQWSQLHAERRERYFAILRRAEAYWSKPAPAVRRVWTHVPEARAAGSMLLGLADGFAQLGLEARALRLKDTLFTRFYRSAHDFYDFRPDLILGVNHSSNHTASFAGQAPISRLVWYVDHPDHTAEIPYHPLDRAAGVAPGFEAPLRKRGAAWLGVLPGASGGTFEPPPLDPDWLHDIAYVGSVTDQRLRLESLPPEFREWIETAVARALDNPDAPPGRAMEETPLDGKSMAELAALLARSNPRSAVMGPTGLVGHFVYAEANSRRRVAMLAPLRDMERVGIYGPPDWESLLPPDLRHRYMGPVESNGDLAKLYRRCKINLSIQSLQGFDFVNLRTFQVPSAGGFLLTEDIPALDGLFELDEMARFKPDGLAGAAEFHLRDEGARRAMIHRAQRRIAGGHTYADRAKRVLEWLG